MGKCLRTGHTFSDFVWNVLIGIMPELIAIFAIASYSLLWMSAYIAFMMFFAVIEVRFLCSHCPYYGQQPGLMVHCKSMWFPSKWFKPKPGALSSLDKSILYVFFVLAFSFPLYWLALQPKFLVLYLLMMVVLLLTYGRYECNRCMFFGCPFNRVDKATRDSLLESEKRSQCTSCK